MSSPESTTSSATPPWRVTSQAEQTIIGPNGAPVDVMQVTFVLPDGTGGTVNVPVSQYNVDAVRAAIAAKAATLHAVNQLTG